MSLRDFGKVISLQVFEKVGNGREMDVLDADGLRVDFDIQIMPKYNTARFDIYNLNNETVKGISNGERYVRIATKLHDQEYVSLGMDYFISNSSTETKLPNKITSLYCVEGMRRTFLEAQIHTEMKSGGLEEHIKLLTDFAKDIKIDVTYKLFPTGILKYVTAGEKVTRFSGSIEDELAKLARMYHFQYYLEFGKLVIVYRGSTPITYKSGGLADPSTVFKLDVEDFRANPIVGAGSLQLELNLIPEIRPGNVISTEDFITATPANQEALRATIGMLKSSVTKFSNFQVTNVIHRGSNFTDLWNTTVFAYTADEGNRLSKQQFNWYGRD